MADINESLSLLSHALSAKRRSGAKHLRKLSDIKAGPALLEALKREISDSRTWETQYQMIMAIGYCNFREAVPYLRGLADQSFEATMIYTAIGDALLRLSRKTENDCDILLELIEKENPSLVSGATQAMAVLRMVPDADAISKIISYARSAYSKDWKDLSIIWVLRATPGWNGPSVDEFLERCNRISFEQNQQIYAATKLAIAKKYQNWSPA